MFHKRLIPYPMFQAFDRPDLMVSCSRRQNTTVAPQAMVILNDTFVRSVANNFAHRLRQTRGDETTWNESEVRSIVDSAFEACFARAPSESETEVSVAFITAQTKSRTERGDPDPPSEALVDFCQSLFGLNEFIYVD
jgi:hypothetical protein